VSYLTPRAKSLLLGLTGLLCIAEIWIAGLNYANHQIWYGAHGWFPGELAFLLHYLLFGIPAILLLTRAARNSVGPWILDTFDRLDSLSPREVRAIVFGASSLMFFLITLARIVVLKDAVISDDENAYVFMAQLFAAGKILVPAPPESLRPFFENQFLIIRDGKMYGIYFPGHPAALAIGEWLGGLHWVSTVAGTLTVPLAFGIARRLFGQRTALLALPMLLLSPYFVFSSATLLAHSTMAVLLMTFVYAALRAHESPGALRWWLLAGAALGWAALTRPFSAPAFAAPWLGWLALRLWTARSPRALMGAGASVLIMIGAGLLLLAYQQALSGSPFESGYQTYSRIRNWGLVGKAVTAPPPLPSIHELGHTLARFNFWLFGWPVSLLFVGFFQRLAGGARLFASCAGVLLVYTGISAATISSAGPAHYAELAAPLVLLSASGFARLLELSRRPGAPAGAPAFTASFPLVATLCALVTFLPVYGGSLRASADLVNAPYELVTAEAQEPALVFVQSLPGTVLPPFSWAYYRRNNRPDLSDRVLFVNFLDPERNKELMRAFPDRVPYVIAMDGRRLVLRQVSP